MQFEIHGQTAMRGNLATALVEEETLQPAPSKSEQTLDDFLRMWAERAPNALAFADAPNRNEFAIGDVKRLTFSEVYEISGRLAQRFRDHGLHPGHILALQLPNIVELPVLVLAALRAGLIACPFPFLWRTHEIEQAFNLVPARALMTVGDFDGYSHSQMMCDLAFDHLSVRFIYGVGPKQADGVTSLDGFFEDTSQEKADAQNGLDGLETKLYKPNLDDPALITWSMRPGIGLRPIYRTHRELIASGLMHVLELGLKPTDRLLNPYPLTGLIGLSGMFMPSLLIGSSVTQHHPFNYQAFIEQISAEKASYAAAPAPVLEALIEDGVFSNQKNNLQRFGCVWQAPHEKLNFKDESLTPPLPVYDIRNLHETAVYISKRDKDTKHGEIKLGDIRSKEPNGNEMRLLETRFKGRMRSSDNSETPKFAGTLFVRGVSVPTGSGIETPKSDSADFTQRALGSYDDWVNTGVRCCIQKDSMRMDRVVCEATNDVIYHGGAMIFTKELDDLYAAYEGFSDAAVFTYPDPVLGERIFAAVVPKDTGQLSKEAFDKYLTALNIAPYKIPEKLVIVSEIPRGDDGNILREAILEG